MQEAHQPHNRLLRFRSVAFVALLIVAIFFVSRGCQTEGITLTQDEAVAIARGEVDFEPSVEVVRLVRRGVGFKPHWAVSLSRENERGELVNVTVVIVDADTGRIVEVHRNA